MRAAVLRIPIWAALIGLFAAACTSSTETIPAFRSFERVGAAGTNRIVTPVNQILTPVGQQVELPDLRPQTLALSPDGRLLLTSGKTHEVVAIEPQTGKILQRVPLPSDKAIDPSDDVVSTHILEPDKEGQVSFTGLVFSPDGSRIYLSNARGSIKVFAVDQDRKISGLFTILLPAANTPGRKVDIPSGLALSPDG